jgi:hypothetical protein
MLIVTGIALAVAVLCTVLGYVESRRFIASVKTQSERRNKS